MSDLDGYDRDDIKGGERLERITEQVEAGRS